MGLAGVCIRDSVSLLFACENREKKKSVENPGNTIWLGPHPIVLYCRVWTMQFREVRISRLRCFAISPRRSRRREECCYAHGRTWGTWGPAPPDFVQFARCTRARTSNMIIISLKMYSDQWNLFRMERRSRPRIFHFFLQWPTVVNLSVCVTQNHSQCLRFKSAHPKIKQIYYVYLYIFAGRTILMVLFIEKALSESIPLFCYVMFVCLTRLFFAQIIDRTPVIFFFVLFCIYNFSSFVFWQRVIDRQNVPITRQINANRFPM